MNCTISMESWSELPSSHLNELEEIAFNAYSSKLGWIYAKDENGMKEMLRSLFQRRQIIVAKMLGSIVGYCVIDVYESHFSWDFLYVLYKQRNFRALALLALDHVPCINESYIHMLAVDQKFQNQGIGSKLLQEAYTIARMKKKQFISLHVTFENKLAHRLYQREGFLDEDKEDLSCCLPGIFNSSFTGRILMRKRLHF